MKLLRDKVVPRDPNRDRKADIKAAKRLNRKLPKVEVAKGFESFKTRAADPFETRTISAGVGPDPRHKFLKPLGFSKGELRDLGDRIAKEFTITKVAAGAARGCNGLNRKRGGAAPRGLWTATK